MTGLQKAKRFFGCCVVLAIGLWIIIAWVWVVEWIVRWIT